jgi:hypothetical protein
MHFKINIADNLYTEKKTERTQNAIIEFIYIYSTDTSLCILETYRPAGIIIYS